ncbi:Pycsar system effector family protein [Streptomyces sp. H27-D2]|uniref:Pycsar system effector family protein n=1 Tax=Streptomyces sp. H27-D2 TaxID=3046304 RepID=UPI002DB64CCF|nr:Pycsar system effector family protein [Streptomyces sp. H27-D2]MEC4015362.1 Pycsar system effector family protein [Streptomyces sp. H27-D2]
MATTAPNLQPDRTQDRIAAMMTTLQADLARSDSKASLLLALAGAGLVAVGSTASKLHPTVPAAVAASLGAAALLAATLILLLAVRPNLRGSGWTSWPQSSSDQLRDWLTSGYQVDHLRFMAALAMRKFRLIRVAVDCMLAGLGLLALAAVLVVTV